MKTFSGHNQQGREIAKSFIEMLAENEQMRAWIEDGNNNLTVIINYIKGIKDPRVTPELKESLTNRIEGFSVAISAAKQLSDPNLTDEVQINTLLSNFENGINSTTKSNTIFLSFNTFSEDISNLLNKTDHDIVDAPEVKSLWNMVSTASQIEGLAESKHAEIEFEKIGSKIADFNNQDNEFKKKFSDVVIKMHKASPDLTPIELEGVVFNAKKNLVNSQGQLATFKDPVNVEARKVKRQETQQQIADRRKEIEEARERTEVLREKERVMENEGAYSFKELGQNGPAEFAKFDQRIADDEKALTRLDAELQDAENKKKLLNNAEDKLKKVQEKLDNVLAKNNASESFNTLQRTIDKTNAASNALSIFEELDKEKNNMYPALLDNGIITFSKNLPKTVKEPGVTISYDFLHKKELAEKYVQMREAIIEASDNKKEAMEFFDHAENSTDCAKIMTVIQDKFVKELEATKINGITAQNEMSKGVLLKTASTFTREEPKEPIQEQPKSSISKFFGTFFNRNKQDETHRAVFAEREQDQLNFMSIEGLPELIAERDNAKKELDTLRARLTATRDTKAIKKSIGQFKESIEETKSERIGLINDYLDHFELDRTDKEMSFEELFQKCEIKLSAVKLEVKTADDISSQINMIREESNFNRMLDEVSEEREREQETELTNKVNRNQQIYDKMSALKNDFDSLLPAYKSMANNQKSIKTECSNVMKNNNFDRLADELSSVSGHMTDAKRLVSHTNTEFFNNMTNTLSATVLALKDNNLTKEQKIAQLDLLKKASQKYLDEKKSQKLVINSAMRKDRIAKATLINKLADDEIKRQEALQNTNGYKNAKKFTEGTNLNTKLDEATFTERFKQAQQNFAQKQKGLTLQNNVAEHANNAPEKDMKVEIPELI